MGKICCLACQDQTALAHKPSCNTAQTSSTTLVRMPPLTIRPQKGETQRSAARASDIYGEGKEPSVAESGFSPDALRVRSGKD